VGTPQLSNDVINTPQGQSVDQSSISLMNIKAPKRPPIYIFINKKHSARVITGRVNLKVVGTPSRRVFLSGGHVALHFQFRLGAGTKVGRKL
jgi:hypothetical protein